MIPAAKVHASISFLCDARELRFLYDLMQDNPRDPGDHPVPEFHALLVALERMWGGAEAKQLTVTSGLMYDLVTYAMRAHRTVCTRIRPGGAWAVDMRCVLYCRA